MARRNQLAKCTVSSTHTPMATLAVIMVPMSSAMPHQPIMPNTTAIGQTLGSIVYRPARTSRNTMRHDRRHHDEGPERTFDQSVEQLAFGLVDDRHQPGIRDAFDAVDAGCCSAAMIGSTCLRSSWMNCAVIDVGQGGHAHADSPQLFVPLAVSAT